VTGVNILSGVNIQLKLPNAALNFVQLGAGLLVLVFKVHDLILKVLDGFFNRWKNELDVLQSLFESLIAALFVCRSLFLWKVPFHCFLEVGIIEALENLRCER